ncbi:MAG: MarR family transcriptional regulator [Gammaproteobacteria bacterium]|nr:MarR family transcriptional regulator [Gammaproteobacteria bacterium]
MKNKDSSHSKNALRAWIQLLKSVKRIESQMNSHFVTEHGSSMSRFDVLANLDRCPNKKASTSQLSSMLLSSKGNITRLLDRMEDDGLVKRTTSTKDKRISEVAMTDSGKKLFSLLAADHEQWINSLFEEISNDDLLKLIDMMSNLRNKMGDTDVEAD